MTRFFDGQRVAEVTVHRKQPWNGLYSPDTSKEFCMAEDCLYHPKQEAYIVRDVMFLKQRLEEWKSGTGDYMGAGADPQDEFIFYLVEPNP